MNIKKYTSETFDQIKHFSDEGNEFWYARELASVLDYKRWDKFKNVIEKAKESCNNSGLKIEDHFSHVGNMVDLESAYKIGIRETSCQGQCLPKCRPKD